LRPIEHQSYSTHNERGDRGFAESEELDSMGRGEEPENEKDQEEGDKEEQQNRKIARMNVINPCPMAADAAESLS
jgi:hypothetical protein